SFQHTPTGFIPQQDKGYLLVHVQLPDASSVARTERVIERMERIALGDEELYRRTGRPLPGAGEKTYAGVHGVKNTVGVAGQSILLNANAPNFGATYVMRDDFH